MSPLFSKRTGILFRFIQKLRKLPFHYKEKGFWGFFKHICARIIAFGQFAVFEKDLSGPIKEAHAKIQVNIRTLSRDESHIDKLVKFWPAMYAPSFSTPQDIKKLIMSRLSAGDECLIAEYQGKITHMNWIGFQNTGLFNPFVLKRGIGPNEALSYNTYCAPEYRGNNLMAATHYWMLNLMKSKGYKKMVGYVLPHNTPSMKVSTRLFGEPVQTLHFVVIFGVTFYFLLRRRR